MQESDVVIMIGGRLDNQMNFGNPPFFPKSTHLVCVNGSHEGIGLNRSADSVLLSDPGAFLNALLTTGKMFEGLGGYGELVETREWLVPAMQRALASGKTAALTLKQKAISARLF